MILPLNEPASEDIKPIYLKDKWRLPSVTDVKFINRNLLLVAHRYAYKLYLVQIDESNRENPFHILTTFRTKDENEKAHLCESFEYDHNSQKIYLIFFSDILWILDVDIDHSKITLQKSIVLPNKNTYHGMKIYQNILYFTPSNMKINKKINYYESICKINITNYKDISYLPLGDIKKKYRIKDILFLSEDLVLCPVIYKTNISLTVKDQIFNGAFILFEFPTMKLLDRIEYQCVHFDRIIGYQDYFYITGQNEKCGIIYQGHIKEKKIEIIREIEVDDFPHGLDIYEDRFAYTSYGSSSLIIKSLQDFL